MRSVVPPAAICTRQLTELKVLKAHTISDLMEPDSPEKFAREHSNLRDRTCASLIKQMDENDL